MFLVIPNVVVNLVSVKIKTQPWSAQKNNELTSVYHRDVFSRTYQIAPYFETQFY